MHAAGFDPEERAARMREERRAQVIAAAKEVFAERGYHNASVNDIIERAGIARGTFYLYFTGKAHVFASVLEEALAQLRRRVRPIEIAPGAAPPHVQLQEILRGILEQALAERHFTRLLLALWLSPDEEVSENVSAFHDQVLRLIAKSLERGMQIGLVRPCDPELIAPAILGAVRGMIGHLLVADPVPSLDRVVDNLIDFAVRGVGVAQVWKRT